VFYNGYKPDPDAVMKEGHSKNAIHKVKNGIFTRGVLIDIPRLKVFPISSRARLSRSRIWRRGNGRQWSS
jgi:hypothetical protein